ncbi:MAG: tRNA glutamyl-Q(34) synthetase GluQRS, partial [Halofilum sp. (in: g-proteobacteria)]
MTETAPPYVGRFAPSPTGPLHFGSLVAALGSYCAARAVGGRWHLRIDDLDTPRLVPGAVEQILRQLEAFGFDWDGSIYFQSDHGSRYEAALEGLRRCGAAYTCSCTRKEITAHAERGVLGPIYPGTCRDGMIEPEREPAWRLQLPAGSLQVHDLVHGDYRLHAALELGDPMLRRRDGVWGYHLATTIDDAALGVTDVVRGSDLLPATLIQSALQTALGLPSSRWAHLPLARTRAGEKLSKQTGAEALDSDRPLPALLEAWRLLGQAEPPDAP